MAKVWSRLATVWVGVLAAVAWAQPVQPPILNRTAALENVPTTAVATTSFHEAVQPWFARGTSPEGTEAVPLVWRIELGAQPSATSRSADRWLGPVDLARGTTVHRDMHLALPAQVPWPLGVSYAAREDWLSGPRGNGLMGDGWFQLSRPELTVVPASQDNARPEHVRLVYDAAGFAEFVRVDGVEGGPATYVGTNGAAGLVRRVAPTASEPELFVLHDAVGTTMWFFGFAGPAGGPSLPAKAAGQLWKVQAGADQGVAAFAGDATSAAEALESGFDVLGRITTARDSTGRYFLYSYGEVAGAQRLVSVHVHEPSASGMGGVLASVQYRYAPSQTDHALPGDLQSVVLVSRQSEASVNLQRMAHFRYKSFGAGSEARAMLSMVVDYEGARRFRFGADEQAVSATIEDLESASSAELAVFASWRALEIVDGRIKSMVFDGRDTGASWGISVSDAPNGLAPIGPRRAVVTMPAVLRADGSVPERTAFVQYFDAQWNPVTRVVSASADLAQGAASWIHGVLRDEQRRIRSLHTPANGESYNHADWTVNFRAGAGLVSHVQRVSATDGQSAGTVGLECGLRESVGASESAAVWMHWSSLASRIVHPAGAQSAGVRRAHVATARVYPIASTDRDAAANYHETTYTPDYFDGTLVQQSLVTSYPIVPMSQNGSDEAQTTREYFDLDERMAYHVSQGKRITAVKYDSVTGAVATSVVDFDTARALLEGWTFIDKTRAVLVPPVSGLLASTSTSSPNVIENPYHQVSTFEYDPLGRLRAETGADGVRSEVWRGKLANELSTTIRVPAVIGPVSARKYIGPASLTVSNHDGASHWTGKLQVGPAGVALANPPVYELPVGSGRAWQPQRYQQTTEHPTTWLSAAARHPLAAMGSYQEDGRRLVALERHVRSADGSRLLSSHIYFNIRAAAQSASGLGNTSRTAPGETASSAPNQAFDQTDYRYDALGRLSARISPAHAIDAFERDALGRVRYRQRGSRLEPVTLASSVISPPNMRRVAELQYDGSSAGGNGLITQVTLFAGNTAGVANPVSLDTTYNFVHDARGRQVGVVSPISPHASVALDNLGRTVEAATFGGDRTNYLSALPAPGAALPERRSYDRVQRDPLGQVFRAEKLLQASDGSVQPSADDLRKVTDVWYGPHGKPVLIAGDKVTQIQYNRTCQVCAMAQLASAPTNLTYAQVTSRTATVGPVMTQVVGFNDRSSNDLLMEVRMEAPPVPCGTSPWSTPGATQWLLSPQDVLSASQERVGEVTVRLPESSSAPGMLMEYKQYEYGLLGERRGSNTVTMAPGERPSSMDICLGLNCPSLGNAPYAPLAGTYGVRQDIAYDARMMIESVRSPLGGILRLNDDAGRAVVSCDDLPPERPDDSSVPCRDPQDLDGTFMKKMYRMGLIAEEWMLPGKMQFDDQGRPIPNPSDQSTWYNIDNEWGLVQPPFEDATKTTHKYPEWWGTSGEERYGMLLPSFVQPNYEPLFDPEVATRHIPSWMHDGQLPQIPSSDPNGRALPEVTLRDFQGRVVGMGLEGMGWTRQKYLDHEGRERERIVLPAMTPGETSGDWENRVRGGDGFALNHQYNDNGQLTQSTRHALTGGSGNWGQGTALDAIGLHRMGDVGMAIRQDMDGGGMYWGNGAGGGNGGGNGGGPNGGGMLRQYDHRSQWQLPNKQQGDRRIGQPMLLRDIELPGSGDGSPFTPEYPGGGMFRNDFRDLDMPGGGNLNTCPTMCGSNDGLMGRVSAIHMDVDPAQPMAGATPIALNGYTGSGGLGMMYKPGVDIMRPLRSPGGFPDGGPSWGLSPQANAPKLQDERRVPLRDVWVVAGSGTQVMDYELQYSAALNVTKSFDRAVPASGGPLIPTFPPPQPFGLDEIIGRRCDDKPIYYICGSDPEAQKSKVEGGMAQAPFMPGFEEPALAAAPLQQAPTNGQAEGFAPPPNGAVRIVSGAGPPAMAEGAERGAAPSMEGIALGMLMPPGQVQRVQTWQWDVHGNPVQAVHTTRAFTGSAGSDPPNHLDVGDRWYRSEFMTPAPLPDRPARDNRFELFGLVVAPTGGATNPSNTPQPGRVLHDHQGNVVCDGERYFYSYDGHNQLTAVYHAKIQSDGTPIRGDLFARFRYNAFGWRIEARYDTKGDGTVNHEHDLCERYVYDRSWRLVAIYRNVPGYSEMLPPGPDQSESPGPKADVLYQRLVYHATGVGGFGNAGGGGHDALVLRQRWLPIIEAGAPMSPSQPPRYTTELLWYVQNRRGDVVGMLEEKFDGSGNPAGRRWVERVKYTPWGAPTCFAAADLNFDGVVDEQDYAQLEWLSNLPPTGNDAKFRALMDENLDGVADGDDYNALKARYAEQEGLFSEGFFSKRTDVDQRGELSLGVLEAWLSQEWGVSTDNRIGFASYVWDPFLKVYHVRNRVYNPNLGGIGRWMQKDPIGLAGGDHNFYRYVLNEPWGYTDPMGLWGEGFAQWLSNQGLGAAGDVAAGSVAAVGGALEGGVVGAANMVVGAVQSVGLAAGTIADGVGMAGEVAGAWRYDADLTPQAQRLAEQGTNIDVGAETQAYSERALVGMLSLGATEILYGVREYDKTGDEQALSRHMGGVALGAVLVKAQASKPGAPTKGPSAQPKPGQAPAVKPGGECGGAGTQTIVDPATLRFSQRTAGGRDGGRANVLRESMRSRGWDGDPVDVVRTSTGELVTIDNTRVAVAQELGIKGIPVRIHGANDPLPANMAGRFGESTTWGEALGHRTGNQNPPLPATGTPDRPRIK